MAARVGRHRRCPHGRSPGRLGLAAVCAALALASACSEAAGAPTISGEELARRLAAGDAPLVLDVRTPEEFAAGRVPGAVNIPHAQLPVRIDELGLEQRAREIVVYCESGRRAAEAESTLRAAGFTDVRHLSGDMRAWRRDQRPCEACEPGT
jgi:rhodanese-related sulfurtransferase